MGNTATLHRNVQFIYERCLAKLELMSFGITKFRSKDSDPWTFHFNGSADLGELSARSAYFGSINGTDSVYRQLILPEYQGGKFNLTRSVNQYLTHWIYPYKGKFHPQMIRALLNILDVKPGQLVLDPFLGSGTTAIECMVAGVNFVGIDISPLCVLISRVKTRAWEEFETIARLVESGERPQESAKPIVRDFFRLADLVTESDVAVRKRDRSKAYTKNLTRMLRSITDMDIARRVFNLDFGSLSLVEGDCRDMRKLGLNDFSVDAIITSPPYSIALDYVKNDAHALVAMGEDIKEIREDFIGVRGDAKRKMSLYNDDMKKVFAEMARVLKPNGVAVVVIGNATYKEEITTTEEMKTWGAPYGLRYEREMPKIVYGLYSVITDEKLLFFRRER